VIPQLETAVPTYVAVGFSSSAVTEGSTVTFLVSTQNVADGVTVDYTATGVSDNDLASGELLGTIEIQSGTGSADFTFAEDGLTEGTDTLVVTLAETDSAGTNTNTASASCSVIDTSNDPNSSAWLDDTDTAVEVRSIIGSTSMTFAADFAENPTVPLDIQGRTSGAVTTITAITANGADFIEVNDTGNSTSFQIGEEVNLVS